MDADFSMESSVVATAKGSIQISECDTEGKFVKIFNSSANVSVFSLLIVVSIWKKSDEQGIDILLNMGLQMIEKEKFMLTGQWRRNTIL